jgi:hypothetical protein
MSNRVIDHGEEKPREHEISCREPKDAQWENRLDCFALHLEEYRTQDRKADGRNNNERVGPRKDVATRAKNNE